MARKTPRIVAVANEKGGVGKTAMVINLAAALVKEGRKVLVVDMDPQHNATSGLGISVDEEKASIYDVISGENNVTAADALYSSKWPGLDVLASHPDLAGAEVELVYADERENRLKNALRPLSASYDIMILDTPPSLSLLTINVFACATEVLVPCQTHPYAYNALEDLFDTIFEVQKEINPQLSITGLVPTFFDGRMRVCRTILDRLRSDERYRPLLFDVCIRSNVTIAASADAGKPVVFHRSTSYGAQDYKSLAREFLRKAA
ncbi:MAG: AAA family ATPase [Desulfosalsimonadaceae bacterium]